MSRFMETLKPGEHACLLYGSEKERLQTLSPFIWQGIINNDKIVYLSEKSESEEIKNYISENLVNLEGFLESGQFQFRNIDTGNLLESSFYLDRLFHFLGKETENARKEGYSCLRISVEASWLSKVDCMDPLTRIESEVNYFFNNSRCLALCQYNRYMFSPETLFKILHSHPKVAINDEIHSNIYYLPPEKYLLNEHAMNSFLNTHEKIEEALCNISIEGLREQLSEAYCMGYDFQHPYVISLSRKLDRLH